MSITVNNIPKDYTWAKLTSMTAQEKTTVPAIAGNAQIAFSGGIPTLTTTETSNSSSITINFTAGNDVTSKTFYFPLPVAEYPALELSIGNGATSQVLKTKALDAKRNERYTTTITLDEVSGSVPTTVESVSEVADALKETNFVSVADVASTEPSPTVSIPKKIHRQKMSAYPLKIFLQQMLLPLKKRALVLVVQLHLKTCWYLYRN